VSELKSLTAYLAGLLITVTIVSNTNLDTSQIISVTTFIAIILGAIFFWRLRLAFALAGVSALLFLKVLDVPHLMKYAHFDVILFLMGMMIVIGFLEEQGFFEHILEILSKYFSRSGFMLVAGLLLMSATFAALVDEVTSILFMTALTLRITKRYDLDPLPMVIATVMATNVGSSFTVVGNPIGVLIAFEGGLSFLDFIRWATPVGVVVLMLTIMLVFVYWRPYITKLDGMMNLLGRLSLDREIDKRKMRVSWAVFLCTICGLVLHHPLEELLHLERNTLLLAVPLIMAGITLFISREQARGLVEHRVDWWTLAFFIFFFSTVGTLSYTGVTEIMAETIITFAGGNPLLIATLITWTAGILSAFMDNILAVATLISIVHGLEAYGYHIFPTWWGMLFGACYLGNLTMIGSTANIVALGILEKERGRHIHFLDWFKPGLAIAVPELALATVLLLLQHFIF